MSLEQELARIKEELLLLEDPHTIYQFGLLAFNGDGEEQNYSKAATLFKISAKQGHSGAQHHLALMLEEGLGVPQDYAQALEWYLKAAEQGNARSQNNLGIAYLKGQGAQQDDIEAANWLCKAAGQGLASAQYLLGLMYSLGRGVPKDINNAKEWLQLAATQGHEKAKELIEELFAEEEASAKSDNAEIAAAEAKMATFIDRATRIIYTTEKDLFRALEESLLVDLNTLDLLIAYIAIDTAASTRWQIEQADRDIALKTLYAALPSLLDLRTREEYTQFLEGYRLRAVTNLLRIEFDILIGKTAYESDEHSYAGILYSIAKAKMGPLSQEERQKARELAFKQSCRNK
jgi:TPR repeat protein